MKNVLIIEPDRTIAKCIKDELEKRSMKVSISANADAAIEAADKLQPDAVVTELSLAGHSGTEFLYEFRTYPDWSEIPIIIYSSMKLPDLVTESHDWKHLKIAEFLYKPNDSLVQLANSVESLVG